MKAKELDEKIGKIVTAIAIAITAATVERVVIKFLREYLAK